MGEIPEKSEPNLILKEARCLTTMYFVLGPIRLTLITTWLLHFMDDAHRRHSYATVDIRVVSALLVISTILLGFCLLMVQCEECEMWHLLYSPRKLSPGLRKQLSTLLEDYTHTCGATLSDLELPDSLSSVCVRDVECYDPLEKLYFSMKVWSDLYLLLWR